MGTEHPGPPGPGVKRGEAPVLGAWVRPPDSVRPPDTCTFPKSYSFVGERELLLFLCWVMGTLVIIVFQTFCTNYMFFPSLMNSEYIYLFK